jgi:hypothetical protein
MPGSWCRGSSNRSRRKRLSEQDRTGQKTALTGVEMGKKCPHCRLINLAYAQHCDCGYRFPPSGEIEETRSTWLDIAALAVAVLTFLLVALPIYLALVTIGATTGAIAMCATAPYWWVVIILALVFVGPLLGGGLAAARAKKWFVRRIIKHQT